MSLLQACSYIPTSTQSDLTNTIGVTDFARIYTSRSAYSQNKSTLSKLGTCAAGQHSYINATASLWTKDDLCGSQSWLFHWNEHKVHHYHSRSHLLLHKLLCCIVSIPGQFTGLIDSCARCISCGKQMDWLIALHSCCTVHQVVIF